MDRDLVSFFNFPKMLFFFFFSLGKTSLWADPPDNRLKRDLLFLKNASNASVLVIWNGSPFFTVPYLDDWALDPSEVVLRRSPHRMPLATSAFNLNYNIRLENRVRKCKNKCRIVLNQWYNLLLVFHRIRYKSSKPVRQFNVEVFNIIHNNIIV